MRALLLMAGIVATVLVGAWAAARRGDADWLAAPPEAVAEGFLRQLLTRRFERARPYLVERLRETHDARALSAIGKTLEDRVGRARQVETRRATAGKGTVDVEADVRGSMGQVTCAARLAHERGEWRVGSLGCPGAALLRAE
jgi:hypothetical protein